MKGKPSHTYKICRSCGNQWPAGNFHGHLDCRRCRANKARTKDHHTPSYIHPTVEKFLRGA